MSAKRWKVKSEENCAVIIDEALDDVCFCDSRDAKYDKENAAFIVRAVNEYEALRESHKELLDALDFIAHQAYDDDTNGDDLRATIDQMRDAAFKAISRAEGV
jgi:hypothetical protein